MITVIIVVVVVGVIIGGIYLAMMSGTKGGRHDQASRPVVKDQEASNPRGDVRSGTGLD